MVTTRVDIEEIQTTKSEKLLALVLAAFLLVGGVWAYQKIDDAAREWVSAPAIASGDQAAVARVQEAQNRVFRAAEADRRAQERLAIAREAYRTELDAGRAAPALERRYREAQAAETQAAEAEGRARADLSRVQPEAREAQRRIEEGMAAEADRESLLAFAFRLALVVSWIAAGYALLSRLRRRGSRYLPTAMAVVGTGAILALVLATDYVTDYADPFDLGILFLAATGAAMTLLAFWVLQRYLARRIPARRVRKGECPFCGYPVRENEHCEGCGRDVLAACSTCGSPRRVGVVHCGACGAA